MTQRTRTPNVVRRWDTAAMTTLLHQPAFRQELTDAIAPPRWEESVHRQATQFADQLGTKFNGGKKTPKHLQWKRHLADDTWGAIQHKAALHQQLLLHRRWGKRWRLAVIFQTWKHRIRLHDAQYAHVLAQQDQQVAWWWREWTMATAVVKQLVRRDDQAFYEDLAVDAGRVATQQGLTALWKKLRFLLPRHRNRKQQVTPDLFFDFLNHFETLEAGDTMDAKSYLEELNADVAHAIRDRPDNEVYDLATLPTLCDVERLCQQQKPGKAAGPDSVPSDLLHQAADLMALPIHNLVFKSFLQAQEAAAFKGGTLQPIWKGKSALHDAAGYRGILMANCAAKIGHAWARQQLTRTFQTKAVQGATNHCCCSCPSYP